MGPPAWVLVPNDISLKLKNAWWIILVSKKHGNMTLHNNQRRPAISVETFWMWSLVMHNVRRKSLEKVKTPTPSRKHLDHLGLATPQPARRARKPSSLSDAKWTLDRCVYFSACIPFLRYSIPVNTHVVLLIKTSRHYCTVVERNYDVFSWIRVNVPERSF